MVKLENRGLDRGFLALTLIFLISLVLLTPRLYSGDEIQYFSYLRSIWKDGDLNFANEYYWLYQQGPSKQQAFRRAFMDRKTPTGYARNDAPIGCAILWAPFFGAADLYVKATGKASANGFSFPYILAVCFASAFYGFLGFHSAISNCARFLFHVGFILGSTNIVVWSTCCFLHVCYATDVSCNFNFHNKPFSFCVAPPA